LEGTVKTYLEEQLSPVERKTSVLITPAEIVKNTSNKNSGAT